MANDPTAAVRLKHALRRYATLQGHVAAGEVKVVHVPDKFNAADFLTKWVSAKKVKESVAYTSNEVAKPKGPIAAETNASEVEMTAVTNLFGLEVSALELLEPETKHADPKYFAARLFTTDEFDVDPAPFAHRWNESIMDNIKKNADSNPFTPRGIFQVDESIVPKPLDLVGFACDKATFAKILAGKSDHIFDKVAKPSIEVPFDLEAFARDRETFAKHLTDNKAVSPFGRFANDTVRLYFGPPYATTDDAGPRDACDEPTNKRFKPDAKATEAPGWGGYETMTKKDEQDVADDLAEAHRELSHSAHLTHLYPGNQAPWELDWGGCV